VLVEIQPHRQLFSDGLMQTGREQSTDVNLCHDRFMGASSTPDTPGTSAAIVAGGRARRFAGQDKSRLVVEGRTIIVRQLEILQRVASPVFVVGPDPARFDELHLAVHPDIIPNAGALGGIYTALVSAPTERVLVVACDLPYLHAGVLSRLVTLAERHDVAWVETPRGAEPLLACYHRSAAPKVLARIESGQLKAADLASALDVAVLGPTELEAFGPTDRLLANVNTAEDYARVQYGSS
jgi:molybdenum cofactor guanylyltransferase